jgi:hypothetical protein
LIPASSWLLKKSLFESLGGWRYYKEVYSVPSQDFLFRAWKSGRRLCMAPHLGLIALGSKTRIDCYKNRDTEEHARVFQSMKVDPSYRDALLYAHLSSALDAGACDSWRDFLNLTRRFTKSQLQKVLGILGVDYRAVKNRKKYGIRGGAIMSLRKKRGLDER